MTTPPVSVERRVGQRFTFNLPVSLRRHATGAEGLGFTQDVSSRGAFFFTDMPLDPGTEIELTLKMPSEITLGESMQVRCKGRVLRVVNPLENRADRESRGENPHSLPGSEPAELKSGEASSRARSETRFSETRIGVAVCFDRYEYLSETEDASADFRRISALHGTDDRAPVSQNTAPRGATH